MNVFVRLLGVIDGKVGSTVRRIGFFHIAFRHFYNVPKRDSYNKPH